MYINPFYELQHDALCGSCCKMRAFYVIISLTLYKYVLALQSQKLYRVVSEKFSCQDQILIQSCSLIQMNTRLLHDSNYVQVPLEPGLGEVLFRKVLHWQVKNTILSEFQVETAKHHGYMVLLYGRDSFATGYLETDQFKFTFTQLTGSDVIMKQWHKSEANYTRNIYDIYSKAM